MRRCRRSAANALSSPSINTAISLPCNSKRSHSNRECPSTTSSACQARPHGSVNVPKSTWPWQAPVASRTAAAARLGSRGSLPCAVVVVLPDRSRPDSPRPEPPRTAASRRQLRKLAQPIVDDPLVRIQLVLPPRRVAACCVFPVARSRCSTGWRVSIQPQWIVRLSNPRTAVDELCLRHTLFQVVLQPHPRLPSVHLSRCLVPAEQASRVRPFDTGSPIGVCCNPSVETSAQLTGYEANTRTLDRYRVTGEGPPFSKLCGCVRYVRADLDDWVQARRRLSTSDDGGGEPRIDR